MPAAGACVNVSEHGPWSTWSIWDHKRLPVCFLECLLARGSLKLLLVVSCRPLARGGFPGAEPRKPPACLVSYSPLTSPRSPSSTRARTSEESGRRPRRLLNRSPRPPRRGTAAAPRPCSPPGSWERPTRRGPARSCPSVKARDHHADERGGGGGPRQHGAREAEDHTAHHGPAHLFFIASLQACNCPSSALVPWKTSVFFKAAAWASRERVLSGHEPDYLTKPA